MTRLEYAHYDSNGDGYIRGVDFANSVAAAADVKSVDAYLDKVGGGVGGWGGVRVSGVRSWWSGDSKQVTVGATTLPNQPKQPNQTNQSQPNQPPQVDAMPPALREARITFKEFASLAHLRRHLHRLTYALEFSQRIGRPVERGDLIKLTQRLLGVKLTANVVEILFALCADDEGRLDGVEMVRLLRQRERMPGRKVGSFGEGCGVGGDVGTGWERVWREGAGRCSDTHLYLPLLPTSPSNVKRPTTDDRPPAHPRQASHFSSSSARGPVMRLWGCVKDCIVDPDEHEVVDAPDTA